MNQRQKKLFKNLVKEHIDFAQAVGSRLLVDKYSLDVSPATVRNDMSIMEDYGFLTHLHTSGGRVPTEKGYKFYVDNFIDFNKPLNRKDKQILDKVNKIKNKDVLLKMKRLAKQMAELSNAAVFIAFDKHDVYYTGISNLFSQPEFRDFDAIYHMGAVIDHLDEGVGKIYNQIQEVEVNIGSDNSFNDNCAAILAKVNKNLIGILGPMRMDYQRNICLVNYTKRLINN